VGIRQLFAEQLSSRYARARTRRHEDSDEEDAEVEGGYGGIGKRRRAEDKYPAIPSNVGRALMGSGTFGDNELYGGKHDNKKNIGLAGRIFKRELGFHTGLRGQLQNRLMVQVSYLPGASYKYLLTLSQSPKTMIPPSAADTIIHYDARCYSGQFSDDGTFFFSCGQDFKIRLYDTSNPYRWNYYKTIQYPYGQWTLTDASLSPDNKFLACSSINTIVCLAPTDPNERADPLLLDFSASGPGSMRRSRFSAHAGFGVRIVEKS
jgi:DDB1- and CUL4-associated factor 11